MSRSAIPSLHRSGRWHGRRRSAALVASFAVATATILTPTASAPAAAADVGQGFTVTPRDLSYILKQIKIAETHVANTTSATGPCGALLGTGPNQLPSPLLSPGLRTVDGSCNNLVAGQGEDRRRRRAVPAPDHAGVPGRGGIRPGFGPPAPSSYAQKTGNVFDTRAAHDQQPDRRPDLHQPGRHRGGRLPGADPGQPRRPPCTTDPDPLATRRSRRSPADCTPSHQTLFIPNVTTDVGLSPPYNSMFTLFGQFFDHGVDQTVKGGGTVFVPLKDDDPLIAGPDHNLRQRRRPARPTCASWC